MDWEWDTQQSGGYIILSYLNGHLSTYRIIKPKTSIVYHKALWYPTVMWKFLLATPNRWSGWWTLSYRTLFRETVSKYCIHVWELTAVLSVHVALAVSGLGGRFGVNMVDRGCVGQRPLCRGQIDSENAKVSQTTNGCKFRWPVSTGDC